MNENPIDIEEYLYYNAGSGESYLSDFQILPEISVSDGTGRGVWGVRDPPLK